jgi:hypothetical protein
MFRLRTGTAARVAIGDFEVTGNQAIYEGLPLILRNAPLSFQRRPLALVGFTLVAQLLATRNSLFVSDSSQLAVHSEACDCALAQT